MTDPASSLAGTAQAAGGSLYDEIMAEIEPDLVSGNIDGLAQKYSGETEEEAAARADRYNAAYAAFDLRFAEIQRGWAESIQTFQHQALQSTEREDRQAEQEDLTSLEQTISAS